MMKLGYLRTKERLVLQQPGLELFLILVVVKWEEQLAKLA